MAGYLQLLFLLPGCRAVNLQYQRMKNEIPELASESVYIRVHLDYISKGISDTAVTDNRSC